MITRYCTLLLLYALPAAVHPQLTGEVDAIFGEGGVVVAYPSWGDVHDVALSSSGKILVTGVGGLGHYLRRYLPDGNLDGSFGNSGTVFLPGAMAARRIALQPDGRIILAGNSSLATDPAFVARLHENGELDNSFGDGGVVDVTLYTHINFYRDVKVLADGSIALAGSGKDLPFEDMRKGLVLRLNANGSWHNGFGDNGAVSLEYPSVGTSMHALTQDENGRLVIAGGQDHITGDAFLLRLMPNGSYDSTFGTNGMVTTYTGQHRASRIAVGGDGTLIYATGVSIDSPLGHMNGIKIARFNSNGSVVTSHGEDGWFHHYNDGVDHQSVAIEQLADGSVLCLVPYSYMVQGDPWASYRTRLIHLGADGLFTGSFGGSGWMEFDLPGGLGDGLRSMAMNEMGWVLAGTRYVNTADQEGIIVKMAGTPIGILPHQAKDPMIRVVPINGEYYILLPEGQRTVRIELYDVMGRNCRMIMSGSGSTRFQMPGSAAGGTYILRVYTQEGVSAVRFVH